MLITPMDNLAPKETETKTEGGPSLSSLELGMTLKEIEKTVILETLKQQNFNRTRTAKVLDIGIRTLQRKLKQYSIVDEEIAFEYRPRNTYN